MPIAFLLYFITPEKHRNLLLILLSLVFYSWGEVRYFPIMIASIVVDFFASGYIEKHRGNRFKMRVALIISVVYNLGMLGFFKYTDFFISNINALLSTSIPLLEITLPLGISFYTFQTMSYTIDVYMNKVPAEKNIINFGAFVVLFPQLIAGPIVRYTDIKRELTERKFNMDDVNEGVKLFIMGVASKVLIANNLGLLWDEAQLLGFGELSMPMAWLSILAFHFQIYFDFSGYSLMAIGLGRIMGFRFPKNFDFPYISRSMTEFWRRWHMTLGSWFREYLYFPLGGNRKGKVRNYVNLFIVWACTGFWHGANWNFVLWGLFFFVFLSLERMFLMPFLEKHKIFSHIYIWFFLCISWAIFDIIDIASLGVFIGRLFSFDFGSDWIYYLRNYGVTFIVAGITCTPVLKPLYEKIEKHALLAPLFFGVLFTLSVAYLVDATYNPFLYFRF